MICKFCKNEIPDTSLSCPVCGKTLYEVRQRPMPEVEKEPVRAKSPLNLLPLICGVLALVAIIIAIVATVSVKKNSTMLTDSINTEVAKLEQRISVMEYKLKDMEEKAAPQTQNQLPPSTLPGAAVPGQVTTPTANPDANAKKLTILAKPTAEERQLGYKSQDGHYLFGFIVEGDLEGFKWEKKQPNGSWAQLNFDNNGFNKQYGISVLIDLVGGSTKLVASGLTKDSAGEYKCTAYGKGGDTLSASVTLKIVEEPAEAPAQQPNNNNTNNGGQNQQPHQSQDFDDETMSGFMG